MRIVIRIVFGIALLLCPAISRAQIVISNPQETTGTVESISSGLINIKTAKGEVLACRIQGPGSEGVALSTGALLRFPAQVRVTGEQTIAALQPGQMLKFVGLVNRFGKTEGAVKAISLVEAGEEGSPLTVQQEVKKADEFATCEIIGEFTKLVGKRMLVKVGSNPHTRQANLTFAVAEDCTVQFKSSDYRRAAAGAKVKRLVFVRANTGDVLVQSLELEVTSDVTVAVRAEDKLAAKYRNLSAEPVAPRAIRSQHFMFMSDISERQAAMLLDKLETMFTLLSAYFESAPSGMVEGFIVHDLKRWPAGVLTEPAGIAKIREGAGICFSSPQGNQRRATIYSCDDFGVIQHEATHGFCYLAFGGHGPTWLSEGVAELGNYWKQDELAVEVSPAVLSYIQNASTKKQLLEIAVPGQTDPGTWQDYSWRWALCHLLAYNPNYSDRFKPMAVAFMQNRPNVSFENVYGPVGREISFEYEQFLQNLAQGYRADLCAWQWKVPPKPLLEGKLSQKTIKAQAGWQATGVELAEGTSYNVVAQGEWKISATGTALGGEGDAQGRGKLIAAIFHDYKLSEPFPVGNRLTFKAPSTGHLVLRCQDEWNQLADNSGDLIVNFRLTPQPQVPAKKD
jgi:hypothetical protein